MKVRAWTRGIVTVTAAAVIILPFLFRTEAHAAVVDAPGAPGASVTWRNGDTDGVGTSTTGTSTTGTSKVWYTLTNGTLSETYHPAADTPNVRDLGFMVPSPTRA